MLALTNVALALLALTGTSTLANPVPAETSPELVKRCVDWIVPEGAGCGNAPNGAYGCSDNKYDIVSTVMSYFLRFAMAIHPFSFPRRRPLHQAPARSTSSLDLLE